MTPPGPEGFGARALLDTVETLIVALDVEGRITVANRKACQVLGWAEHELIGQFWFSLCLPQPEGMERMLPTFRKIVAGDLRAAEYFENPVLTRSGEVRQIAWHNALRHDDRGRIIGTLSSGHDATDRKRAETALHASRQLIEGILNGIPARVFWKDLNLAYLGCNAIFARDAGLADPKDIIGKDDYQMVWRDQAELYRGDDRRVIESGRARILIEEPQTTPDGTTITLLTSKVPLRDSEGRICGVLGTYTDITDRKRSEQRQAELQTQLNQAQRMESVGRLAGGVAHDLNNMLGVILGNLELALRRVHPAQPIHAELEDARAAAARSTALIRQLLAFARRQAVSPEVLDLNAEVARMLPTLHRLTGEHVNLQWEPGADLWPVNVDPSQIDQILTNLYVNATDAIADVGTVTIATSNRTLDESYCAAHAGCVPGEMVQLRVTDTGRGMDATTRSHLFEPFFTTKGVGRGTGLGLATVYGIVMQNDGFIDVSSEPNRGATFTIYLPRHVTQGAELAGSRRCLSASAGFHSGRASRPASQAASEPGERRETQSG